MPKYKTKSSSALNDKAFLMEMQRRVNEIENGTVKGYRWEEVKANSLNRLGFTGEQIAERILSHK